MISLDRLPVSRIDSTVYCPLRRKRVATSECAACSHLARVDPVDPPRFVVCEAPYVLSWLGLDVDD